MPATTPGALSAARLEPELRLCMHTHGTADHITVDQLLTAIHTKDGAAVFFEPPRRVLIESPTWGTRSALALRLLYAWARGPPWPKRGAPPVALAIYAPLSLNGGGGLAAYVERHLVNGKNARSRFGRGLSGRGFQSAWATLPALGQKLLFVLNDDADFSQSAFGPAAEKGQSKSSSAASSTASTKLPADICELLAGRLFPDARVIIIIGGGASSAQHVAGGGGSGIAVGAVHHTKNPHRQLPTKSRQKRHNHYHSSRHQSGEALQQLLLPPLIHRYVTHRGLTWGRSASLLGGGEWGAPSCLLDTVQHVAPLRNIARTPLGCLALAAIYSMNANNASPSISQPSVNTIDDNPLRGRGGTELLPTEEIDAVESVVNYVTAGFSDSAKAALGRLALFSLKAKRSSVTADEIRLYCAGTVELYYPALHHHDAGTRLGCFEHLPAISGRLPVGATAAKTATAIYTPICDGVMEFLAANYLATLAQRPGHLSAEIAGLATSDLDIEPPLLKVLTFAMALLGERGHILLSLLTPLWLSPAHVFALSLAAGDSGPNSRALCALLGINKSPTVSAAPLLVESTLHIWVQCRSTPAELLGWAMALRSHACRLKSLELNYQIDKHTAAGGAAAAAAVARVAVDTFLTALACNESVATLRISSLIETDVTEADVQLLAQCVARALLKPRLVCFELILTLLEEDPPALKLQPVVQALCRSLPRQPALRTVHLDLGLCSSQIIELCATMEQHQPYQLGYGDAGAAGIRNVSLPHLRCERASVAAIARLLAVRKLTSLALPYCWGTGAGDGVAGVGGQTRADDAPSSSSGVSMGSSGAGSASSSTGTSCLIKQSSITSAVSGGQQLPSPGRLYNPIVGGAAFCSLPRGNHRSAMTAAAAAAAATAATMATALHQRQPSAMYANVPAQPSYLGRSATLPRPPPDAEPQYKQRSYDSMVSRTWGANTSATNTTASSSMAAYDTIASVGGVLHDVLMAAREPDSCMAALDLSKAQLTVEDALCLGETVRQSCTLHSVRLEGAARLSEILPAMLGVGESQSVQMLVLASPRLSVDDGAVQRVSRALMCCPTLRLLVLDGWSFRLEVSWLAIAL